MIHKSQNLRFTSDHTKEQSLKPVTLGVYNSVWPVEHRRPFWKDWRQNGRGATVRNQVCWHSEGNAQGVLATWLLAASRPLHLSISWSPKITHKNPSNQMNMETEWFEQSPRCGQSGSRSVVPWQPRMMGGGSLLPSLGHGKGTKWYFTLLSYRCKPAQDLSSEQNRKTNTVQII